MDYENMKLSELKDYAKSIGIQVGNIGKEKLIQKIKNKESESATLASVISDDDLSESETDSSPINEPVIDEDKSESVLDKINAMIDDLDDSENEDVEIVEELGLDVVIPVKSITFGGLIYKSRSTNAVFRWGQIGAIEYMTVAQITEMNSYKSTFLTKPLVILMDERAIKKFRLTSIYENVAKINNLTAIFKTKNMNYIESTIDAALSVNMRDVLISKVRQMYKSKKLTDINIIRLLEKKLQFDLSDSED